MLASWGPECAIWGRADASRRCPPPEFVWPRTGQLLYTGTVFQTARERSLACTAASSVARLGTHSARKRPARLVRHIDGRAWGALARSRPGFGASWFPGAGRVLWVRLWTRSVWGGAVDPVTFAVAVLAPGAGSLLFVMAKGRA